MIKVKIKKAIKGFFWNGLLRTIYISYYIYIISAFSQVKESIKTDEVKNSDLI